MHHSSFGTKVVFRQDTAPWRLVDRTAPASHSDDQAAAQADVRTSSPTLPTVPNHRLREPGRVVRIPLGDGLVGWGRQLRSARVAFCDRFDSVSDGERTNPQEVIDGDIAFAVSVMDRAFRRSSSWTLLDVIPLTERERSEVYRSFRQDALTGALSIYREAPDGSWGEDGADYEQCVGLEPAAVWDPEHVEDRLRDHRAGLPNKWAESLSLRR